MKKLVNYFSLLTLSLFCFSIFVSCDLYLIQRDNRGKVINEYPDWCCLYYKHHPTEKIKAASGGFPAFGYSEWMDWQSDEGKLLHNLIDDKIISDDYSGKYRIVMLGQLVEVCFNDSNFSCVDFFAYIGDYKGHPDNGIVNINTDLDNVKYDCWFRKGSVHGADFKDKCQDSNRAKVKMEKIDESKFNYSLTVASEEIINLEMKNQSNKPEKATLSKNYSWFPSFGFEEVVGKDYWSNGYYGKGHIRFDFDSKDNSVNAWGGWGYHSLYCYEGISLRSVDEENKKISFWLEDREQSGFADYLEIHITKEDWTDEPKRGADKDNKSLMKGTLGFYKEGNSTPIIFYDEEHSEFSRLVD